MRPIDRAAGLAVRLWEQTLREADRPPAAGGTKGLFRNATAELGRMVNGELYDSPLSRGDSLELVP
jgi:hypothetical protein